MSFPCPRCGAPLVHARRRDLVYAMSGRFSTAAYLFPRVFCTGCDRDVPENEWPGELRRRIRSFRVKYALFAVGLLGVILYLVFAQNLAAWWRR